MIKIILIIIGILIVISFLVLTFNPEFGAAAKGENLKQIKASRNFVKGKFNNMHSFQMYTGDKSFIETSREYFFGKEQERVPINPLPTIKFDKTVGM